MFDYSKNIVTINLGALRHNYTLLKNMLPEGAGLLAMVKADGYGHGMVASSKAFAEVGCQDFGVAEVGEGVALRQSGREERIYVFLGVSQNGVGAVFDYDLIPVIFDKQHVRVLAEEAKRRGQVIECHVKVDTGMSRLGMYPDQVGDFLEYTKEFKEISVTGVLSHLARSDEKGAESNYIAFSRFDEALDFLQNTTSQMHIANSGGILHYPESHFLFARAGISLYGYYPDGVPEVHLPHEERLQEVMRFSSEVLQVKTVKQGQGISYGHTYVAEKEMTIAVLPVGYEDGFSRALSNCGEVLIRGKRARICGRVCMNLCMVDVSDIPGVDAGDEVVLLGEMAGERITADDIGRKIGTISYEVLCMIGNNNKRVYQG